MADRPEYAHIKAWGRFMGSARWYVEEEVEAARAERAPADAIFRRSGPGGVNTKQWASYGGVTNQSTRRAIEAIFEENGWGQP